MRIRNPHRSPPFVFTCSDPPPAAAVEEASFPDALISNILRMKSFTEPVNPTPAVLNHHHQYSKSQSKITSLAANMAGVRKPNDNADDGSYFAAELTQIPPLPAIPYKEAEEEIEKLRVCTLNQSPWDVPSFVQAFLTKPTTEPADDQSMQNSSWKRERNNKKKLRTRPLVPKQWKVKAMAEGKQQADVEDDDDFNKIEITSCERGLTLPCGKEVLQVAKEEEQALESALVRVFSEEVAGLTVREAGCKLMLRNANNIISAGLPLSVQVRRAMINSPYFVQMDDAKFVLWDNFLNTKVGRLDEEEIAGSEKEKELGIHKLNRAEDCTTYKGPAKELGQLVDTDLELAVPKIIRTKGKRSRRAGLGLGLGLDMRKGEQKEDIVICKQADGIKRRKSCGQAVEQRSYNSACGILLRRNEAFNSKNNSSTVECNNSSWAKDAVAGSDSQCYYRQSISDGNGRKQHKNGLPPHDQRDRAASSLISCMNGNIGENEVPSYYRKRKPVKARSLNALL